MLLLLAVLHERLYCSFRFSVCSITTLYMIYFLVSNWKQSNLFSDTWTSCFYFLRDRYISLFMYNFHFVYPLSRQRKFISGFSVVLQVAMIIIQSQLQHWEAIQRKKKIGTTAFFEHQHHNRYSCCFELRLVRTVCYCVICLLNDSIAFRLCNFRFLLKWIAAAKWKKWNFTDRVNWFNSEIYVICLSCC